MARGGHRRLSLATKAKIALSLRGNKNAFRGGPKKPLTSRQKVANINAHTKQNRLHLSDAQLKQRAAVAKRLRARARAEEAGISVDHSKPIPTENTIAKVDSKIKEQTARVKKRLVPVERKDAGSNTHTPTPQEKFAALRKEGKTFNEALAIVEGKKPTTSADRRAARGDSMLKNNNRAKRLNAGNNNVGNSAARANNAGGNFGKQNHAITTEQDIKDVYSKLASKRKSGSSGFENRVSLTDLRPLLKNKNKAEVDAELKRLSAQGKIHIFPEDNRKTLTSADHAAALRLGGEDNHLIAMDHLAADRSNPEKIVDVKGQLEQIERAILTETSEKKRDALRTQYLKLSGASKSLPTSRGRAARSYKPKPMPRGGFGGKGL